MNKNIINPFCDRFIDFWVKDYFIFLAFVKVFGSVMDEKVDVSNKKLIQNCPIPSRFSDFVQFI